MGKASRRKSQAKSTAAGSSLGLGAATEPPVVQDTQMFLEQLRTFAVRVAKRGRVDVVALPEELQMIVRYGASSCAQDDLADLRDAWEIVVRNEPVLGATMHSAMRANESHRRWKGPLTPREIIYLADCAPADAGSYRENLAANAAFHARRAEQEAHRASLKCGRPTVSGGSCAYTTIYLPAGDGSTRAAEGLPCWRHASPEETQRAGQFYDAAVAEHDCPGCTATAGQACYTGDGAAPYLRLVDGEWSRTRRFKGRAVHDARLVLARAERC